MQLVRLRFIPCHRRLLEIMFALFQACVELHSMFLTVALKRRNHFAKSRWGAVGSPHMQHMGTMKVEDSFIWRFAIAGVNSPLITLRLCRGETASALTK